MPDQKVWNAESHEKKVEGFYGTGLSGFHDYHGGYLNFGWWKETKDYLQAAEQLVGKVAELLRLDKKSRLLDVACGMGAQDVLIHKAFGCEIDAVDVTWKHVMLARERVAMAKLWNKVRVHHGSATQLSFPERSFSHVMCIEGLPHFNTREAFFKEAFRVLRPGGRVAFADYTLKRKPKGLFEWGVLRAAARLWHVPKENWDTAEEYEAKLRSAGFSKVSIQEVGEHVIPGYYFEQQRPETRKECEKIRGYWATHAGWVIDYLVYKLYKDGLMEYVFVKAEKV